MIEAHVPVPGTPHELTVLVNTREARALAPDAVSLGAAVGQILGSSGAAAVVVKDSARLPGPDGRANHGHEGRPVPDQIGVAAGQRRCLRRRIRQRVGQWSRPRRSGARRQRKRRLVVRHPRQPGARRNPWPGLR